MAPAGVFSLVPGAGGRAALLAAVNSISPRPSTASLCTTRRMEVKAARMEVAATATTTSRGLAAAPNRAVGMVTAGIFSSVPGIGGRGVRGRATSMRSMIPVHTTAALPAASRRREVASAAGVVSLLGASRLPGTRSMAPTFAAAASAGSNAGKGSMEATPAPEPPKPHGFMSKFAEALKKMKIEVQKSAFTILFLLISVAFACVALKGQKGASDVIEVCEKAEKARV